MSAGSACVSIHTAAASEVVWQNLTVREQVASWFGDLSQSLRSGVDARLDFGDGDFFTLCNVRASAPYELSYTWRFLGLAPASLVSWKLHPEGAGSRVTVVDHEPLRSVAGDRELEEGWTDFLQRLQKHLDTHEKTRYDWRYTFDGSIEIPLACDIAAGALFGEQREAHWLPFSEGPVTEGAYLLRRTDGAAPIDVQISGVRLAPREIDFSLRRPSWRGATVCSFKLEPRGAQSLLSVCQSGWDRISDHPTLCLEQRRLFAREWIASLQRARGLAARGYGA